MIVYAIYDYKGYRWQSVAPIPDWAAACAKCRQLIRRHPEKGLNVRRIYADEQFLS